MPTDHSQSQEDRILAILRGHYFCAGWAEGEIRALLPMCRLIQPKKGEVLFWHEEPCDRVFLVARGRVQLFRVAAEGREIALHLLGPGALLACSALFLDRMYPASARVLTTGAELLELAGEAFLQELDRHPAMTRKLIGALTERIGQLAQRIESLTRESALARIVNWLLEQPSRDGGPEGRIVRIEGGKKNLAASLGIAPETFSRALRKLADENLIAVRRNEISLKNPRGLIDLSSENS